MKGRSKEDMEWLIQFYIKAYVEAYKKRHTSVIAHGQSYDMVQNQILTGFCDLAGKSFKYACQNIAEPGNRIIRELKQLEDIVE